MPYAVTGSRGVLVSPRYLAGTTGTDPVASLLEAAAGWTHTLADPDPYYTSPCRRLRAAHRLHGGWTFTYRPDPLGMPAWAAHFDATVPDEVLAAFTERLVDGVGNYFADYLHGGRSYSGLTPAGVFAMHEWEPVPGSRPWRMHAPDEHAAFHLRTGYTDEHDELHDRTAATWKITAGPDPVKRPSWTAHFTSHTPQPLMTAVASAVADPRPVPRPADRVPELHRALLDLQPDARPAQVAAAQLRSSHLPAGPAAHEIPRPPAPASASARPSPRR